MTQRTKIFGRLGRLGPFGRFLFQRNKCNHILAVKME